MVNDGPLSSKEIVSKVPCSTRSVRYALKRLLEDEYIEKRPCLRDMRQSLYSANIDKLIGELQVLRGVR
ncbi:MAG: winged helix-turn-helix domain-containing protein [Candidatus Heimdallarchaeota archaeon]|nr:MAG: winged helix-turn-helix domain-containing protein [Candidatus Heimdallarchaeota archaeon]